MLRLLVLLLLLSIGHLHGLVCYSNYSFHFSRNELPWKNLSSIIRTQVSTKTSQSCCHLELIVTHHQDRTQDITLRLGQPTAHNSTHIEFTSTLQFVGSSSQLRSIVSRLDYVCQSSSFCEEIFLTRWIQPSLVSMTHPFSASLASLWSSMPRVCEPKRSTEACLSHVCFLIYDQVKSLSYGRSQCDHKASTHPIHIHVKTLAYSNTSRSMIENDYRCTKNQCTGQVIYNATLDRQGHEHAYGMPTHLNALDRTALIRLVAIVSVLLVIGAMAYYVQCQIYRQGYRLTSRA